MQVTVKAFKICTATQKLAYRYTILYMSVLFSQAILSSSYDHFQHGPGTNALSSTVPHIILDARGFLQISLLFFFFGVLLKYVWFGLFVHTKVHRFEVNKSNVSQIIVVLLPLEPGNCNPEFIHR